MGQHLGRVAGFLIAVALMSAGGCAVSPPPAKAEIHPLTDPIVQSAVTVVRFDGSGYAYDQELTEDEKRELGRAIKNATWRQEGAVAITHGGGWCCWETSSNKIMIALAGDHAFWMDSENAYSTNSEDLLAVIRGDPDEP